MEYSPVVKVKVRQPSFKVNGKLTLGTLVPEIKFGHCGIDTHRERINEILILTLKFYLQSKYEERY